MGGVRQVSAGDGAVGVRPPASHVGQPQITDVLLLPSVVLIGLGGTRWYIERE